MCRRSDQIYILQTNKLIHNSPKLETNQTTMSTNTYLQGSCNSILDTIRGSSLNYAVQETPYSIYITIRKSEVKFKAPRNNLNEVTVKNEDGAGNGCKSQEDFDRLKNNYEEVLTDLEAKYEYIKKLESLLKISDERMSKFETLEEQFHKNLDENKQLKHRNDTVKREMEEATDKLKDYEDRNYEACAVIKKLQHQIKNLETENKKIKAYRDKVKEELKLSKSETRIVVADIRTPETWEPWEPGS